MCKHWQAPGSITQLGNGKIGTSLSAKGIMHSSHRHTLDAEKSGRVPVTRHYCSCGPSHLHVIEHKSACCARLRVRLHQFAMVCVAAAAGHESVACVLNGARQWAESEAQATAENVRRSDSNGNHVAPADFARAERGFPNLTTHKKARQSRHNLLKKMTLNLTVPYSWGIFVKRDHQACDQPVGR